MNTEYCFDSMTAEIEIECSPARSIAIQALNRPYSVCEVGYDDESETLTVYIDCGSWKQMGEDETKEEYLLEEIEVVKEYLKLD